LSNFGSRIGSKNRLTTIWAILSATVSKMRPKIPPQNKNRIWLLRNSDVQNLMPTCPNSIFKSSPVNLFPFAMSRKSKKLAKRDDDETEDKPVDDHESSQDDESRVRLFAWVRLFRRSLKVFDCVILPPKNVPQG